MDEAVDVRDQELHTMVEIQRLLDKLDEGAASRVVRWLADRRGVVSRSHSAGAGGLTADGGRTDREDGADLATTYEAAKPSTTPERVMVVTYWFQVAQGQADVDSQRVNSELKQLGHGLKNITKAFTELIRERPQLVIQVRKAGSTRQARKRYRLTAEGIKRVKTLLTGGPSHE